MVMGHEGMGSIEQLGPNLDRDSGGHQCARGIGSTGSAATLPPLLLLHRPLGFFILRGTGNLRRGRPHDLNSYAERVLLSDGMAFCRTPDDTPSLPVIAFGCAMPTVLQATDRLGGFQRLDIVVIQGSGPAGLAATAVANLGGVDCVIVIDRFPERLALARRRGVRRRS
jgi:threonine dehydrogenase-like Zn-dependent dehydrogenase